MSLAVHVEPIANGFRASTGSPPELFADAATADEAIAQVKSKYAARLRGGRPIRVLTAEDVEAIKKAAARLSKNTLLPELQQAREEFRRRQDALVVTE